MKKNYNKMYYEPESHTGSGFTTAEFADEAIVTETVEKTPEPTPELGTVNAREVYIRRGPSKAEEHVGTVKKGDIITVLSREGDFLKIETEDGTQAYIMESFVTID